MLKISFLRLRVKLDMNGLSHTDWILCILWNPNLLYYSSLIYAKRILILIEILFISALSGLYITNGSLELALAKASDTDNLNGPYGMLISFIYDEEQTGYSLKRPLNEIDLDRFIENKRAFHKSSLCDELDKKICIEYIKSLELKGKFSKMTADDLYNNLFKKRVFNKSNKATNENILHSFYEKLIDRRSNQFQIDHAKLIEEDLNINPDKLLKDINGDFVIILLPKYPIKDCNCFMARSKGLEVGTEGATPAFYCHCLTKNQWVVKYTTSRAIHESDIKIYDPFLLPSDFDITSCKKLSEFINQAIKNGDFSDFQTKLKFEAEGLEGEKKRKLTLINRVYGHKNLPNDPIKTIEPVLLCTSKASNYFKGNSSDVLYSQFANVPVEDMKYSLNNKWGYRISIIKEINPSILESIWDNLNDKKSSLCDFHSRETCVAKPFDKYIIHKSKVRSNEDGLTEKTWEKYDGISSNFKHHYAFLEGFIKDYLQIVKCKGYNIEPILKKLHYIDKKLESHIKQPRNTGRKTLDRTLYTSYEDSQQLVNQLTKSISSITPAPRPPFVSDTDELSHIIQKFDLDITKFKFEDNDKPSVMLFDKEILSDNHVADDYDKFFLAKNIIDLYTPSSVYTLYKIYGKKYEEDISQFRPLVVCNTVNQFNDIFQTHLEIKKMNELCNSHLDPLDSVAVYHKNNLELVIYKIDINRL
jgi:hypothetical protein